MKKFILSVAFITALAGTNATVRAADSEPDCSNSEGKVDAAICKDTELQRYQTRVSEFNDLLGRLYNEKENKTLNASQGAWLEKRNREGAKLEGDALKNYLLKLYEPKYQELKGKITAVISKKEGFSQACGEASANASVYEIEPLSENHDLITFICKSEEGKKGYAYAMLETFESDYSITPWKFESLADADGESPSLGGEANYVMSSKLPDFDREKMALQAVQRDKANDVCDIYTYKLDGNVLRLLSLVESQCSSDISIYSGYSPLTYVKKTAKVVYKKG